VTLAYDRGRGIGKDSSSPTGPGNFRPEASWYEWVSVCQKIREDVSLAHIVIIMLTAKDSISDKVIGLSFAPDDYVIKPFQEELGGGRK